MTTADNKIKIITQQIIADKDNLNYTKAGLKPVFSINLAAKIVIIGQAPGFKAQQTGIVFGDKSGDILRNWLGVDKNTFYNNELFSFMPMDFYFPGKGKTGDLPPRKNFAEKWHPLILEKMKDVKLIILIGTYANKYYLKDKFKDNLTATVKAYNEYLPKYFPLVHPSPLNFRWQHKNPWFNEEIIPKLKQIIKEIAL